MPRPKKDQNAVDLSRDFAVRLRTLRTQRGLTQAELGAKIGVEGSVVRGYELKLHNPSLISLQRLAEVLGVSVDFLLNGDAKPVDGFQDRHLLELFLKADTLHYTKKDALKQIIEGLLASEELDKRPV